jgi:hypothetical protein
MVGNALLNTISKAQVTKGKADILNFVKIKNLRDLTSLAISEK